MNNPFKTLTLPGYDTSYEWRYRIPGFIVSVLLTGIYRTNIDQALRKIYMQRSDETWQLPETYTIPSFGSLIGLSFLGFMVMIMISVGFIIRRYRYLHESSMSIYLVRRLPRRPHFFLRVVLSNLVFIILNLVLILLFYVAFKEIYKSTFTDLPIVLENLD